MARKKKPGDIQCAPFPMALKKALVQDGATQRDLAAHIGVTPQTVSQYCRGMSEPSFDNLVKIARFFDCSTDFLLGRSSSRWGVMIGSTDSLTLTAEAALAAGMSYGKFVAQYGVIPADTSDVSEPDALADLLAVCPECGVSFYKTHGSQKYCCRECSTRHGCREATRRYRARAAAARDADGGEDD